MPQPRFAGRPKKLRHGINTDAFKQNYFELATIPTSSPPLSSSSRSSSENSAEFQILSFQHHVNDNNEEIEKNKRALKEACRPYMHRFKSSDMSLSSSSKSNSPDEERLNLFLIEGRRDKISKPKTTIRRKQHANFKMTSSYMVKSSFRSICMYDHNTNNSCVACQPCDTCNNSMYQSQQQHDAIDLLVYHLLADSFSLLFPHPHDPSDSPSSCQLSSASIQTKLLLENAWNYISKRCSKLENQFPRL